MNFQKIPPVDNSKLLLDLAFRKAREKGKSKNLKGNWLQIIRQKECLKLDVVKDSIVPRLDKILLNFPKENELPLFYVKLIKLTLDYVLLKQSFGAVHWAVKKLREFHKSYVSKIVKCKDRDKIKQLNREFYGRISSLLKQIDKNLSYLEVARKVMRGYPDIKDMFTICLYGFPNVGKSTLLNKMTGTTAKVASYAFTTKNINAGYFKIDNQKIQVLDVPGTLARQDKMNLIELQADLVLKELADVVIYVFDISEHCGYSLKKQDQLYKNLGKKKKVFIYLSKKDIISKEIIDSFKYKHYSLEEIKEKIGGVISN